METATMAALGGLALVDSTSFGTLGMPAAMLVQRRIRVGMVLLFLATIACFYWLLGLGLVLGAGAALELLGGAGEQTWLLWAQAIAGAALFAASFLIDSAWWKNRRALRQTEGQPRRRGLISRVLGEHARPATIVAVALVAGLIEAASMLPYLAAVGLITNSNLDLAHIATVLAGYVAVMCLPALALLGARFILAHRIEPLLDRLNAWLSRAGDGALSWALGIVGSLVAADALSRLGLLNFGLPG